MQARIFHHRNMICDAGKKWQEYIDILNTANEKAPPINFKRIDLMEINVLHFSFNSQLQYHEKFIAQRTASVITECIMLGVHHLFSIWLIYLHHIISFTFYICIFSWLICTGER